VIDYTPQEREFVDAMSEILRRGPKYSSLKEAKVAIEHFKKGIVYYNID